MFEAISINRLSFECGLCGLLATGVPNKSGALEAILATVVEVSIDTVTQAETNGGRASVFISSKSDLSEVAKQLSQAEAESVTVYRELASVSIEGFGLHGTSSLVSEVFRRISEAEVNILGQSFAGGVFDLLINESDAPMCEEALADLVRRD